MVDVNTKLLALARALKTDPAQRMIDLVGTRESARTPTKGGERPRPMPGPSSLPTPMRPMPASLARAVELGATQRPASYAAGEVARAYDQARNGPVQLPATGGDDTRPQQPILRGEGQGRALTPPAQLRADAPPPINRPLVDAQRPVESLARQATSRNETVLPSAGQAGADDDARAAQPQMRGEGVARAASAPANARAAGSPQANVLNATAQLIVDLTASPMSRRSDAALLLAGQIMADEDGHAPQSLLRGEGQMRQADDNSRAPLPQLRGDAQLRAVADEVRAPPAQLRGEGQVRDVAQPVPGRADPVLQAAGPNSNAQGLVAVSASAISRRGEGPDDEPARPRSWTLRWWDPAKGGTESAEVQSMPIKHRLIAASLVVLAGITIASLL